MYRGEPCVRPLDEVVCKQGEHKVRPYMAISFTPIMNSYLSVPF